MSTHTEQPYGVDMQYLVELYREFDSGTHSYVLGVYGDLEEAKEYGTIARDARGGWYEVNIYVVNPMLYTFTENGVYDIDLESEEEQ